MSSIAPGGTPLLAQPDLRRGRQRRLNGAGRFGCFLRRARSLVACAAATVILAFTWNAFLFSSSLGITQTKMMPAHMAGAVDTRGVQFWFMATRALIAMVPPVLLGLIAQRYIVRGLTLGAVNG